MKNSEPLPRCYSVPFPAELQLPLGYDAKTRLPLFYLRCLALPEHALTLLSSFGRINEDSKSSYARISLLQEVKEIQRASSKTVDEFLKEAAVLQALPAPSTHLVRFLGFQRLSDCFRIYTQVYDGSLHDLICAANEPFPAERLRGFCLQISSALQVLRQTCIMHRDLKSSNVLYELGEGGALRLVLADFGEAKLLSGDALARTCRGSPVWSAPEVLVVAKEDHYSFSADIWSFGMCLYEMMTFREPYHDFEGFSYHEAICGGVLPTLLEDSEALYGDSLLPAWRALLQMDPAERPLASELPALFATTE